MYIIAGNFGDMCHAHLKKFKLIFTDFILHVTLCFSVYVVRESM